MGDLFGVNKQDGVSSSFEQERMQRLNEGQEEFEALLESTPRIMYEDLIGKILERPLIWKSDVDGWIMKKKITENILIEGLGPRERTPKPGHIIVKIS